MKLTERLAVKSNKMGLDGRLRCHRCGSILVYPVRKPQHLCRVWWKKYQLPIEAGVKTLPFLTGFTKNIMASRNNIGDGGVSAAETL